MGVIVITSEQIGKLFKAGRSGEAVKLLEIAIKAKPKDVDLRVALAQIHNRGTRDYQAAMKIAGSVLKRVPNSGPAHAEMAHALMELQQFKTSIKHAQKACALQPKNTEFLYLLATAYNHDNDLDSARKTLSKALELDPKHARSRLLIANIYNGLGQIEDARQVCRDIFAENPQELQLYAAYSATGKASADDPIWQYFEHELMPSLDGRGGHAKIVALHVLAKIQDETGRHHDAMMSHKAKKTLEGIPHNGPAYTKFVSAQVQGISRADYFGATGSDSEAPVLIVGMPRSGSTLLEQIIAAHPKVRGVGESDALRDTLLAAGLREHDGPDYVRAVKTVLPKDAKRLAESYEAATAQKGDTSIRVVDKKLHNFECLGIFAKLFPKARILHATRDPMDCCVSCYVQSLPRWHSYTRDLGNLGRYYKQYHRLMSHWEAQLPNPMMRVPYEDVVADTEGTARKVIEFLGLEWDDACLNYQSSKSQIKTLSVWQVRQPIYSNSVKRWKRYEQDLGPLKRELAPFYPDGFE